jgi:hypothetical protein
MRGKVTPCQAALWFANQGHAVLPLHAVATERTCTCGDAQCHSPGKHPFARYVPRGLKDATADPDTVRGWFAEHYWLNFGVTTDKLLVIDVDAKHSGLETWADMWGQPTRALPHTWQVRTGGGGKHVIFDNTEVKIRCGELAAGIQIKAIGGYIVGAACKHESGRTYEWEQQCSPKDAPLAAPPDWLLTVIKTRTHCGKPTSLQDWRKLARTRLMDGERHAVFLRIAGHLISNPLNDPIEIRELMLGWNRGMCGPPLTEKDCLQMLENLAEREKSKEKWL